ncbi:MAG: alpha-galactosidase [Lachnospiraceae bacterium]|nr:alpha-galactosidase [Lachnospiraceae bacterium]
MAIRVDQTAKTFTLDTIKSTYQMKVDAHGNLLHTYYGARAQGTDFSYLISPADHGFCGQPAGCGDDRTYSMDYLPLEYPAHGNGDYRIKALRAGAAGQAPALDLRYHSSDVTAGKYALPGLPAMFAGEGDQDVQTLRIVLKDLYEEIYVTLLYGVFEKKNIVTRTAVIENKGSRPVCIRRAMSMGLDFPENDKELIHFYGKHAGERQFERTALLHGITEVSSTRGMSGHQHNPFVVLCDKSATEENGDCWGISLLYSGGFRIQTETDQLDQLRIVCGIDDEELEWTLSGGESFATPEAALCFTDRGLADLSNTIGAAFRTNLIRSVWKDRRRPLLVNNWEATYFDFTKEKLLEIARQAAEIGLDMFVLDDGWFGKRDSDRSGLGDWYVNEEKLGCTLRELVDDIRDMGLSFGIWIEPEMVSEDSDLYRAHPDWALTIPGRDPVRGRSQLVLDLSRAEVIEYLKDAIDRLMHSADIAYIKWDMNRSVENIYSAAAPSLSQGAVKHRYVLGLYELLEHLTSRYPDVLLEGCSGGGGRFDAGMLYYAPQIWCSDNTDAVERLRIHYGTSFGYPMSSVAAHVSVCPNEQNGRRTPFQTRGVCAMQGSFGYELDLSALSEEELEEAKHQIACYKEHYELFQKGRYYRLSSPFTNRSFTAWSYVSEDGSEASVSIVFTDLYGNPKPLRVKLKGLKEDAVYRLDGKEYTGGALMYAGIVLPVPECDYDSYFALLKQCGALSK